MRKINTSLRVRRQPADDEAISTVATADRLLSAKWRIGFLAMTEGGVIALLLAMTFWNPFNAGDVSSNIIASPTVVGRGNLNSFETFQIAFRQVADRIRNDRGGEVSADGWMDLQ